MAEPSLRRKLLLTAQALAERGLNPGTAGNVSVRFGGGFLVTPTGLDYARSSETDMVPMDMAGHHSGARKPSSEWRLHRDVFARRPDAGAVIHTHAPFATALACQGRDIPAFHYMIARFGGADVRCAAYATFGTQELSDAVLAALDGRCACLLANHGMVVFGRDLDHALALAAELETLCQQYWRTLQLGPPRLLSAAQMAEVLARFRDYGQQPEAPPRSIT